MIIRKLEKKDAKEYLGLLLNLDNETSFMLLEPGERGSNVSDIEKYIDNIEKSNSVIFVIQEEDKLFGFVSVKRGQFNKVRHNAYIVMGILQDKLGNGLGTKLLEEVEKWASESEISKLELTVMVHNRRAYYLYTKMGYEIEGRKRKSVVVNGELYDEYYMGKLL